MDLKDVDLNDLDKIIKQAQALAKEQMSSLSPQDQLKVNKIVDGTDLNDLDAMSKELENLKTK